MLREIHIQVSDPQDPIVIPTQGVTVFVGPNNSGKSLILKEIENTMTSQFFPHSNLILKDLRVVYPKIEEVLENAKKWEKQRPTHIGPEYSMICSITKNDVRSHAFHTETFVNALSRPDRDQYISHNYAQFFLIRLDGKTRFGLCEDQRVTDLLENPANYLNKIFVDDEIRAKIRQYIFAAFGKYYTIDPTSLGSLRIRLSRVPPNSSEQSLNAEAREYHSAAEHVGAASDGVQAYVGIITALVLGEYRIALIDEPEAFLHPPLARLLGKQVSEILAANQGSLLVSTHSADFLMGCIQHSTKCNVIRLQYAQDKSRARSIDPSELTNIFRRPIMRSANVISSLFHDGTIVCESDNDRAFYGEVFYRVQNSEIGYPSILTINAQNKQTIRDIIGPLRKFGVPAAAICDIDIIKDGGKDWSNWMDAANIPELLRPGLADQRHRLATAFVNSGKNMKTSGGVALLSPSEARAANEFFDFLDEYGIFVVRHGELEGWLDDLMLQGKGTDWTIRMLERLGSDPGDPAYVHPSTGDVWEFCRKILRWVSSGDRKGQD